VLNEHTYLIVEYLYELSDKKLILVNNCYCNKLLINLMDGLH